MWSLPSSLYSQLMRICPDFPCVVYLHFQGVNDKTMQEHARKDTYDRPSASLVAYLERNKRKCIDRNRERQGTKLNPRWVYVCISSDTIVASKLRHCYWLIYVFTISLRFGHKESTFKNQVGFAILFLLFDSDKKKIFLNWIGFAIATKICNIDSFSFGQPYIFRQTLFLGKFSNFTI